MTETTALAISEEQERAIETGQGRLLAAAQSLVVDSLDSEQAAWEIVNGIGDLRKLITADFADSKRGAHAAWKAVVAQERGHLDRLDQPDHIVRAKLSIWGAEKERIRREAERKAREEAERVAAEARRVAQEKARVEAEERRLAEAVAAEEAGKEQEAEALLEKPVEVEPVPEVAPVLVPTVTAPKVEGAGAMVETWHFEVANPALVPREYLVVDEKAIRRAVTVTKGEAMIPGVRIWNTLEPRRGRR